MIDETSEVLRDNAAAFLRDRYDISKLRGQIGMPRPMDRALWSEMAELGWLMLELSEVLHGGELGLRQSCVLAGQFGRSGLDVSYLGSSVFPATLLAQAPCSEELRLLANDLAVGKRIATVAWQEFADQISGGVPETRLKAGRISGRKCFVAGTDGVDLLLVSVSTDAGTAVVAVESSAPGISRVRRAAGLGSEEIIEFREVPILAGIRFPDTARPGGAIDLALDQTRIALSAYLHGLATGLLDRTLDYVKQRVQFGRAIGSFQAIHHRCVDLHIAVQLAGASWRNALAQIESGVADARAVSASKARCADVARQVGKEAIQMHGAMGFTEESDVGFFVRAALHGYAWLGSPQQHRRRFMAMSPMSEAAHV